MMRSLRFVLLISFTILLTGCPARSIHPLFTEKEALFNASLVGTWTNTDESYTFEKLQEKNYRLVIRPTNEEDSAVYIITAGKIGSVWFLDSYPIVNSKEHLYFSMHVFTRLTMKEDSIFLETLEADWLLKMDTEKKLKIPHVRRENEIILTASTNELQQFFASILTNSEAFPDKNGFGRKR